MDADRLDGDPGVQRGLEHGPAEGALGAAAPGAALGEDADRGPGPQQVGDVRDRARQGAQAVPVDEHDAGAGGQRTGDRPLPDLGLGDHAGRAYRGQQRDVQPGDVVGDQQQAAGGRGGAGDADPDPAAHAIVRAHRRTHGAGTRRPSGSSRIPPSSSASTTVSRTAPSSAAAPRPAGSTHAPGVQGALGSQTLIRPARARGSASDSAR
ncbi:hypothetical protein GCM10020295_72490 [Streptomyces cinereospinus]